MTPEKLIETLGGSSAIATELGLPQNTVSNWRARGFPAWALGRLAKLCEERGIDAGDILEAKPPRSARWEDAS